MPAPFASRLEILPPSQLQVWRELVGVPPFFTLYGGTAIALHLGHRTSVDFDLFAKEIFQQAPDTLICLIDRGAPVHVSFFGLPEIGCVEAPHICLDNGLQVASLTDLAGTKAVVVQNRSQAKDYMDEDPVMFAAHVLVYGTHEDVKILRQQLNDEDIREALEKAPPGVFDARSWTYWNLKFGSTPARPLPARRLPA